jgi:hypothetical protein
MTPHVKTFGVFFRDFYATGGGDAGRRLTASNRSRRARTYYMRGSVTPFCPWYLPPRSR